MKVKINAKFVQDNNSKANNDVWGRDIGIN